MTYVELTRGLIPGIRGIHQTGEDGALIGAVVQEDLRSCAMCGPTQSTQFYTWDYSGSWGTEANLSWNEWRKWKHVLPKKNIWKNIRSLTQRSFHPDAQRNITSPSLPITSPSHDHSPAFAGFTCGRLSIVNAGEWMWNEKDGPNHDLGTRSDRSGSKRHLYIYHHLFQPQLSQHDTTCTSKQSYSWGHSCHCLALHDSHDLSKHGDPNGRNKNNKSIKNTTSNNYQ